MQQTLSLENRVNLPLRRQPVRQGVPWPRGTVAAQAELGALDEQGRPVPCAVHPLNLWPDGSAQWSLVDLVLDFAPSGRRAITITTDPAPPAPVEGAVAVTASADRITVSNGLASLTFGRGAIIERWTAGGRPVIEDGGFDVLVTGEDGAVYSASVAPERRMFVEESSTLCAVVRIEGKHRAQDARTLLDFWLRFRLTAGRPDVRITYHYHNLEKPEPGVNVRSIVLELRTGLPTPSQRAIVHLNRGRNFRTEYFRLAEDFEIASSDTMDLSDYEETHQRRGILGGGPGRAFIRQEELLCDDMSLKPWFLRNVVDFKFQTRNRGEGCVFSYIGMVSTAGSLVVAGGNMVGFHPKALSVTGSVLRYSVWPEWAGLMDITQGEGRTLDLYVGPLPPDATDHEIASQYFSWEAGSIYGHMPVRPTVGISLDPAHVRRCQVFSVEKLPPYDPQARFAFERKVKHLWTPDEPVPAYGHWHYGDVFSRWDIGVNNDEMAGHVWFQEYLRTGRPECLDRGLAQAQHIAEVDLVAYSSDPYQSGGMCAHGPRHNHCAAYPSHMWFTELLFAYALTGDEEFKKATRRACDNLVFWINDPEGFQIVSSDGREGGQPLINLSWTYPFIPDRRYLEAMWKVVRESCMAKAQAYGRLVYMKLREDMPLVRCKGYGDHAAWEGLYFFWELTRDEELRRFVLGQLDWRLTEDRMGTYGGLRETDYNAAA